MQSINNLGAKKSRCYRCSEAYSCITILLIALERRPRSGAQSRVGKRRKARGCLGADRQRRRHETRRTWRRMNYTEIACELTEWLGTDEEFRSFDGHLLLVSRHSRLYIDRQSWITLAHLSSFAAPSFFFVSLFNSQYPVSFTQFLRFFRKIIFCGDNEDDTLRHKNFDKRVTQKSQYRFFK